MAVNRRSLPFDGIAEIESDGLVRFTDRTAAVGIATDPGGELRQAAAAVEGARSDLALTGSTK